MQLGADGVTAGVHDASMRVAPFEPEGSQIKVSPEPLQQSHYSRRASHERSHAIGVSEPGRRHQRVAGVGVKGVIGVADDR